MLGTTKLGFSHTIFWFPSRMQDWGLCLILDLRGLNHYLQYLRCKMLKVPKVRQAISARDWFTTIDLNDTCFQIPIWQGHCRFLRFEFLCTCLAPQTFTRCMGAVLAEVSGSWTTFCRPGPPLSLWDLDLVLCILLLNCWRTMNWNSSPSNSHLTGYNLCQRDYWTPCSVSPQRLLQVVVGQERGGPLAQPCIPTEGPVWIPPVPFRWASNSSHWEVGPGGSSAPGCLVLWPCFGSVVSTRPSIQGSWVDSFLGPGCPTRSWTPFRRHMPLQDFPSLLECVPTLPGGVAT